jgi:hypothetical protein
MRLISGLTAAVVGVASATWAAGPDLRGPQNVEDLVLEQIGVAEFTIQRLDLPAALPAAFDLAINIDGVDHVIHFTARSVRAANFQLTVEDETGRHIVEPPAPATFVGTIDGWEGATAAAGLADGGIAGSVYVRGEHAELWGFQPLSTIVPDADPALHIVYDADAVEQQGDCGVEGHGFLPRGLKLPGGGYENGGGLYHCEMLVDSDFDYYTFKGSNVNTAVAAIESVFASVNNIYINDIGLVHDLIHINIRTVPPPPYVSTNAETLLNEVRNTWLSSPIVHDLATMFSGKDFQGSIIGIAYLNGICTSLKYSTVQQIQLSFTGQVGVVSHELGHNYCAPHCDAQVPCYIMCSALGGCNGLLLTFEPSSQTIIKACVQFGAPCLQFIPDEPPALPLPFFDGFDASDTFDGAKWALIEGATISTEAVNEISGTRSVKMVLSNRITTLDLATAQYLTDLRKVYLLFWIEERGLSNFEAFQVEYFSTPDQVWKILDIIVAKGVNDELFRPYEYELSLDAYGDDLAIRFTAGTIGADRAFFLDNVGVSLLCRADLNGDKALNIFDFLSFQAIFSLGAIEADWNRDGALNIFDYLSYQAAFSKGCY